MIDTLLPAMLALVFAQIQLSHSFGWEGKSEIVLSKEKNIYFMQNRGFYNNTSIQLKIDCLEGTKSVKIGWLFRLTECINEFYLNTDDKWLEMAHSQIFLKPATTRSGSTVKTIYYKKMELETFTCDPVSSSIELYREKEPNIIKINAVIEEQGVYNNSNFNKRSSRDTVAAQTAQKHDHSNLQDTIAHTWQDGAYSLILLTDSVDDANYSVRIRLSFEYNYGFLSASDWPFLPFFGVMCGIYSLFAIFWLIGMALHWRDLLRIQLWIGGVILLGLMEKAAYLAEYEGINRTGSAGKVAMITAETISCFKRSLARMLVIVVSLGFGIVKPRLGPAMQKVVSVGALYFILALIDGMFRILERKEDTDSKGALAGVPLVVIDVSICYWILTNLQQTMRTLRVRRNIPKLSLYRHFTNTLIFCVIASIIFMIWSLKRHRFVNCLKDWKELWLDDGFWHILFSFILLVIMILWRPSNNSQRFAFSPLIDEDDEDEMDDNQENEIFDSVKMRTKVTTSDETSADKAAKNSKTANSNNIEDELKWVEENVPSTITEAALPGLADSEEEIMTTRFEISKMD